LPSVSIHVTVKNAEDTIKKCVDSLLRVDYPNKEIYVTEAYSTDNTYEILKRYGGKIKLEKIKGNAPRAHNHVFNKVKTDFIAFTDSDCVVDRNWLKNLVKAFVSDEIIASGGLCKTPKDVNDLQRIIGMELENRFLKMPKYVGRLPTMNFCVRTDLAKKVKMDESLDVTFEAEWGKRLTKFGKMAYVPNAVVYHYHRSTWRNFFSQQMRYGKFVARTPFVYISGREFGDYLSKPLMGLQLIAFNLFILSLIVSLLKPSIISISPILLLGLITLYVIDISDYAKTLSDVFKYLTLFSVRTFAWTLGFLSGIFSILRGK